MNFTLIPVLFLLNGLSSCNSYKQQGCLMDNNCGWCEELEVCIPYDACINNTECPGPINSIQVCTDGAKWVSITLLSLTILIILFVMCSTVCSVKKTCKILKRCHECSFSCFWRICYRNELEEYAEIL